MSEQNETAARKGFFARLWALLWRPTARFSLATLLIVGFAGGVLAWGGFNWVLELTNTEAFCISCHEMRDNPYKELQSTIHFKNRSGVRATCPDCHVPREWIYKIRRKIVASNELLHKILGTVNTPEKFEKHRLALATKVWETMRANDSHECRNCHTKESMEPARQKEAAKIMFDPASKDLTCIDCHAGIAHKMPKDE